MKNRGDGIFSKHCEALDERLTQSLGRPLPGEARLMVHLAFYRMVSLSQIRRISLQEAYQKILPALPANEEFGVYYRLMFEAAGELVSKWEQEKAPVLLLPSRRQRSRHVSPAKIRQLVAGVSQ